MKKSVPIRKRLAARKSAAARSDCFLEMSVASKPELLCVVRGAVEKLTEKIGFPADQVRAITLAVDEAMTNIIRHSYCGREDKTIEVYFRSAKRRSKGVAADGLEIVLHDSGPKIDPAKLCGRDFDDVRPGGLGLHFIEECMDGVEYSRLGKINQWTLVKFINSTKEKPAILEEKIP
jgi:serine/threonine-protein kinase RsbW